MANNIETSKVKPLCYIDGPLFTILVKALHQQVYIALDDVLLDLKSFLGKAEGEIASAKVIHHPNPSLILICPRNFSQNEL
jgi:hypothetical protein